MIESTFIVIGGKMSDSGDTSHECDEIMKKRKNAVEFPKHTVIKRARVKNEAYINWKGDRVEPKHHGYDCK